VRHGPDRDRYRATPALIGQRQYRDALPDFGKWIRVGYSPSDQRLVIDFTPVSPA
jgi:hypothetical protein